MLSALLAPIGYVVQDVVADAMTVEAVPTVDDQGNPFESKTLKLMHTTMQTLGRVAIVGGGIGVSLINILLFNDVASMVEEQKVAVYIQIYKMAMIIPLISICGVILAEILKRSRARKLRAQGIRQGRDDNLEIRCPKQGETQLVDSRWKSDICHFYPDDGVITDPLQPGNYFCRINGNCSLPDE